MSRLVFVCTGNTCRSPMAEAFFNLLAENAGKASRAFSCGLTADGVSPASKNAVIAAGEYGASLSAHRARPVTEGILREADAVYAMTRAHLTLLRQRYPALADKLYALPGGDVPDPYGGGLPVYRATAGHIHAAVAALLEDWE